MLHLPLIHLCFVKLYPRGISRLQKYVPILCLHKMGPSPDLYHVDVYIAHTSRWQYAEELKFTNQEFFIFSIHFFGYKV